MELLLWNLWQNKFPSVYMSTPVLFLLFYTNTKPWHGNQHSAVGFLMMPFRPLVDSFAQILTRWIREGPESPQVKENTYTVVQDQRFCLFSITYIYYLYIHSSFKMFVFTVTAFSNFFSFSFAFVLTLFWNAIAWSLENQRETDTIS